MMYRNWKTTIIAGNCITIIILPVFVINYDQFISLKLVSLLIIQNEANVCQNFILSKNEVNYVGEYYTCKCLMQYTFHEFTENNTTM